MGIKKSEIHLKIWGHEEWIVNKDYCGKFLVFNKGYRSSLHLHITKDETFYVEYGDIAFEYDGSIHFLTIGDIFRVEPGKLHRFNALSQSKVIEFSTHHNDSGTERKEIGGKIPHDEISTLYARHQAWLLG